MYVGKSFYMKADISWGKAEIPYPETVSKFLKCICTKDIADELRDTTFKVPMGDFHRAFQLPAL